MKTTLTTLMALLFAVTINYGQGAFASNCPTIEQQQAAFNLSKASGIVVRDTASQQLQCYYQQLGTWYQQTDKDNQQKAKDIQQIAKDQQQIEADARQIAKEKAQVTVDAQQGVKDTQLKAKELELAAREALLKNCEEETKEIYVFCNELKLILEKPDCDDKKLADHVKLHVNHSGQADGTNPGSTTNNNGGILNPHAP